MDIEINPQSIFWNIELVAKEDAADGKYAELQWGWTAGMSEEDLKNVADDAPTGYDYVRLLPDQARELRDKLNTWLAEVKPLHKLTSEEKADIEACMGESPELVKQLETEIGELNYDGDSTPIDMRAPWED